MVEQQELTTLQLKEADVLTVHYMFPGAYRNTAHQVQVRHSTSAVEVLLSEKLRTLEKEKVQVIRVNKRASRVNLKKGDVVLWSGLGHTNIYAGKNSSGERLWFDAGKAATYGHHSGSRFNNIGKKTQGYLNSKTVSYIIRIKGL